MTCLGFSADAYSSALALLTTVVAPTQFLWKLSVAATEGGHWLAVGALVTAIPWRGQGWLGKLGGIMGLGAAVLFAVSRSTTPTR